MRRRSGSSKLREGVGEVGKVDGVKVEEKKEWDKKVK